jgi:AcrR family transcriptional regulator
VSRPAPRAEPTPARRRRRDPDSAKASILEAAKSLLESRGPDGFTLREVARAARVTHPLVLHHFGSRERLIGGLIRIELERLRSELVAELSRDWGADDPVMRLTSLLDRVFATLGESTTGRVFAWSLLSGRIDEDLIDERGIADLAASLDFTKAKGLPAEERLYAIILVSAAALGFAVSGQEFFRSAGLDGHSGAESRWRAWLSELLLERFAPKAPRKRGPASRLS